MRGVKRLKQRDSKPGSIPVKAWMTKIDGKPDAYYSPKSGL